MKRLTAQELAEIWRCGYRTVMRYKARGMPGIKIAGKWLFNLKECERWIARKG